MSVEATLHAFVTCDYKMREFLAALGEGDQDMAVKQLTYAGDHMIGYEGWVQVGTARILVEVLPLESIQIGQLDALTAELQKVRAENQQRENAILDRISKLQAIEYVEAA